MNLSVSLLSHKVEERATNAAQFPHLLCLAELLSEKPNLQRKWTDAS